MCIRDRLCSGTFVVERQYASKVSCSQFWGTPLLSAANALVAESRTVIRSVLFGEAFANMAANKKPTCKAAILRIFMKPTPPNTAHADSAHLVFPNDFKSPPHSSATFCSPWCVSRNSFHGGSLGRRTHLRARARMQSVPRFLIASAFNLHRTSQRSQQLSQLATQADPVWAR